MIQQKTTHFCNGYDRWVNGDTIIHGDGCVISYFQYVSAHSKVMFCRALHKE